MAIRRPPTTFSDTISTADIADDAITGGKLANDISISTTGNIATTGSGVITSPIIQTDSVKDDSGTRVLASDSGSAWSWGSGVPVGTVLQVQSTVVTDRNSSVADITSGTGTDVGLNVTITPKKSGSHFFIQCSIGIGTVVSGDSWGIILSRDGTKIGNGVDSSIRNGVFFRGVDYAGVNGDHNVGASNHYVDKTGSTAGTSITYKCGLVTQAGTAYINRNETNNDNSGVHGSYTSSSVTVMEIAQ